MRNEDSVKLLGIHNNNNLNFDYHVNHLCKKASKKLHALAGIAKYMDISSISWSYLGHFQKKKHKKILPEKNSQFRK